MPNPEMITLTVGTTTWDIHDGRVGDLSDLTTTDKDSIVDAINEVAQGGGSSVSPYDSNPAAAGTASPGVSALYARGDHVHPAQSVPSPQTSGTPKALGTAARGSATTYSRSDHVHPKPTAADLGITVPSAATATPSALGSAAVGSSTKYAKEDHVHAMPTAANVGAVAVAQGVGHAGEFVVVGSDGNITTVSMTAWSGGNY